MQQRGSQNGQAIAVTREQFDDIMRRRGGGGPSGNGEGVLSGLWKRWARSLVSEKCDELEARDDLSLEEAIELRALKVEFDRVQSNADAAYDAVRKYSPMMNSSIAKAILS